MNFKSILLPVGFLACSAFSIASNAGSYDHIPSTPALDGDVNSSWAVDVFSNKLTIGSTGVFFPNNHKAIITFDTTQVDSSKTILYADARITFSDLPAGMSVSDVFEYTYGNLKIEVAGPFGFGGSTTITALDYYAVPAAVLDDEALNLGWFGDFGINLTDHINPFGQTQIAISLISNPANIAINFNSGEVGANFPVEPNQEPILTITYE